MSILISALATCFASMASTPTKALRWDRLDRAQIATRCRVKATEAMALAESASPYVKLAYLEIAEDWKQLARDIEWAANKQAVTVRSSA